MSAVTEEESWKREMPRDVAEANTGASAHRPKEGGTRQTAKPNANQCHSPVRAGPRGLEEASSDFLFPLYSHLPPAEVYKAVRRIYRAYIHSQRVHRGEEACVYIRRTFYVCVLYATVSIPPCQVPARIIRGERARNTHVLAHSARQIAYACDLRVIIRATHENSFLSPPLFSSRRDKGFDL